MLRRLLPLTLLLLASSCRAEIPEKVIHSPLAGTWYAANADALRAEIAGYLAAAPTSSLDTVCALIVPHAGYRYSGRVAAHGYRAVQGGAYRRVILLATSHRIPLPDAAGLPEADAFLTPLGRVPLDTACMARLRTAPWFKNLGPSATGEHSAEIQMPFLQTVLPGVPLVPIIVGQLEDEAALQGIADTLRKEIDDHTLVIASTDFTHFGRSFDYVPFTENIEENLRALDLGAEAFIRAKDLAGFRAYCRKTGATICGRDGVSLLLALLPARAQPTLLAYDTSGRMTGSFDHSVSYVCEAITGSWKEEPTQDALDAADRAALLQLARETLNYYFEHGKEPVAPQDVGVTPTPGMYRILGAFVTLKERGELRGCIGEIQPRRPVYQAVMEHAVDSAVRDPRFPPVTAPEVTGLAIEISALAPPHEVASYRDIVLGRHGIVLRKGWAQAVFLPQVAPEQGWNLEQTLNQLARKAGLPANGWREGTRFDVFEAMVFGEENR